MYLTTRSTALWLDRDIESPTRLLGSLCACKNSLAGLSSEGNERRNSSSYTLSQVFIVEPEPFDKKDDKQRQITRY
jgi:hypothetical protein